MAFRFHRRIRIMPGVTINLGKRGYFYVHRSPGSEDYHWQ